MTPPADERNIRARAIAALLWTFLWLAVITVVLMTWHPWVMGSPNGCPANATAGWDGRCRPERASLRAGRLYT